MIFRKTRTDEPQAQQEHAEEAVTTAPQPVAEAGIDMAPAAGGAVTVITSDVVMEGNLVTSSELHLDGTIHGAVQADRVIIQENGAVSGQVLAQEVIIYGRVIGPICAVKVHLLPGAQVEGDVLSQGIIVDHGAFIDGQIRYSEDPLGEWQQTWHGDSGQVVEEGQQPTASGVVDEMPDDVGAHGGANAPSAQQATAAFAGSASGQWDGSMADASEKPDDDTMTAPYLRPAEPGASAPVPGDDTAEKVTPPAEAGEPEGTGVDADGRPDEEVGEHSADGSNAGTSNDGDKPAADDNKDGSGIGRLRSVIRQTVSKTMEGDEGGSSSGKS